VNLLTPEETAARLRICKKTLAKLQLPIVRISARKKYYREENVDAFVRSHLQCESTDDQKRKPKQKRLEVGLPRVLSRKELIEI
jgi:hypothetical protein